MQKILITFFLVLMTFPSFAQVEGKEASVHACDVLAADPHDPSRKSAGVIGKNINPEKAIAACEVATKTWPNKSRFWFQLGRAYSSAKKIQKAREVYSLAATRKYPAAQNAMGLLYQEGGGGEKNLELASELFLEAAKNDHFAAMMNFGYLNLFIDRSLNQVDLGIFWLKKAADRNFPEAQIALGQVYGQGLGVPKDPIKAFRWTKRAAENDNDDAMLYLALLYMTGNTVVRIDKREALNWFKKSANAGNKAAKLTLENWHIYK